MNSVAPRERNPGIAFSQSQMAAVGEVDHHEVEGRVADLAAGATAERGRRAPRLLLALRCMDLTTLSDDDTEARVRALCGRARRPLAPEVAAGLGEPAAGATVGAVCVFRQFVPAAVDALAESAIPVAAVAGGFPVGYEDTERRRQDIRAAVRDGAGEIDAVITRAVALGERWERLYDEVRGLREASGAARLKVILATGDLPSLGAVARASWVAMAAGADFIKTSTGRERVNATIPVGVVMARSIRHYLAETGYVVGLKPAGGIRTAETALAWLALVRHELGEAWLTPRCFRIGASGLLDDLERQLDEEAANA